MAGVFKVFEPYHRPSQHMGSGSSRKTITMDTMSFWRKQKLDIFNTMMLEGGINISSISGLRHYIPDYIPVNKKET